ncbi:chemotaxis response regulator protein-glutamate methylesterase [Singulisphaera sp. PoT]|uniref:chemotaxis response regulator protein-glutamate methylesterase n=1 Tax=Singulisphaera sp. PoT TaxID=3411797 RepID=UPI003BF5204D
MRIGIVNDMPMAREALRRVVEAVPDNRVCWMARDGEEAVALARTDPADVILMDLIMPGTDGAEATRRIMNESPCAILVVTATVSGHMSKVYEAMGHGALDAVDTPALGPKGQLKGGNALLDKIATISKLISKSSGSTRVAPPAPKEAPPSSPAGNLVLLGASTGGPKALADILSGLPKNWEASVIIVQHVDVAFAPSMGHWLGEHTGLKVGLIREGQKPEPGQVLLAATNDLLIMSADGKLHYTAEPREINYRPSLDVFYTSVAAHWPDRGVAVLLTGMGRDGAEGLLRLRRAGWHTIAQDERTSVVWGMPRVAAEIGAAVRVLPIGRIAEEITRHVSGPGGPLRRSVG